MIWINGHEEHRLSARDRAVQFGDGCFTTSMVKNGQIFHLGAHLQRLQEGCQRLLIGQVNWLQLEHEMRQLAQQQQEAVLKVIISRGEGGRGYSSAGCGEATRILSLLPYPQHYRTQRSTGVYLTLSPIRLGRNPLLAGIKHLNRLEQVLIRAHLDQSDADEALVLDTEGRVVECCAANLFWRKGEQIFTPNLDEAGVAGTMRRYLLDEMASADHACQVVSAGIEAVLEADEVVICNALMPVLPVRQLDHVTYRARMLFDLLYASCEKMEA